MTKMKETVIILGDSPFLKEVEDKVEYLLYRYDSIGINRVILKYRTKIHAFVDIGMVSLTNKFENIKKLTIPLYKNIVRGDKEIFDTFSFDPEVHVNTTDDNKKLAWCGFTHDYAISYAIHKGYKKVILVGTADFSEEGHYSCNRKFQYSESLREASKRFISEFCSKKVQIYTCNENSCLRVPYRALDELLT